MGITNEAFPTERDESTQRQFTATPNDVTPLDTKNAVEGLSAIEKFAFFMRFLAPPTPSVDTPGGTDSIGRGKSMLVNVGCALCHRLCTPAMPLWPLCAANR